MLRVLLLFALILTSVRGDGKKTEVESTNLRLNSTQVVKYNETTKVEKGCRGPGDFPFEGEALSIFKEQKFDFYFQALRLSLANILISS